MKISSKKKVFFRKFIIKRILPLCTLELKGKNILYDTVPRKSLSIIF